MILQTLKKEWYVVVLLILPFIFSAYIWDELPDEVPTHFNLKGEADDWGPKWVNAIMFPTIGFGTYLLLVFLPLIDPKKRIESTCFSLLFCYNIPIQITSYLKEVTCLVVIPSKV